MRLAASYDALVPLPVFHALKAFPLAAMAFSTSSFHHQVSQSLTLGPSCATQLLSCLEQACLDVVPDILSGSISYTCRSTHMQVEDLLEMTDHLRVFKLPNFKKRGELMLGFGWHINSQVAYKKLMLHGFFRTRDHVHICDKFAHDPMENDEVYLHGCISQLVRDEMAVTFLETYVPKKQVEC